MPLVAAAVLLPPSAVRTTNAVAVFEMMRVRFDDHASSVVALGLDTDDTSVGCGTVSPAEQSGLLRCVVSIGEAHDATVEDVRIEGPSFHNAAAEPRRFLWCRA